MEISFKFGYALEEMLLVINLIKEMRTTLSNEEVPQTLLNYFPYPQK